jgi:hypothetical protein
LTKCEGSSGRHGESNRDGALLRGAAVTLYEAAVFSGPGGGREALPGIGEAAVFIPQGKAAGARTHGVVIVVKFQAHRPTALDGVDVKGAVTRILKLVVGRI